MATRIGIGYSQHPECQEAAFQAATMVRKQLDTGEPDFLILLATSNYCKPEIIPAIRSVLTAHQSIGTMAHAIIAADRIIPSGLSLWAIKSDQIHLSSGSININAHLNLRTAGFELMHQTIKDQSGQRQGSLLFGDNYFHHSQDFLYGAGEVVGFSSPLIGAIGSDLTLRKQAQIHQYHMHHSHAVAATIYSPNKLFVDARHSFKILGKPRYTTKITEYVLCSIDHKPAVQLYEDFFREKAADIRKDPLRSFQMYPLGFYDERIGRYLLRNPVDILADGSIVFGGDIPEKSEVHIMMSSKDLVLKSAKESARSLKDNTGERAIETVFYTSALSRHRILGRQAKEEVDRIRETIGHTVPLFGLISFGEVASWTNSTTGKQHGLNNGGLVLAALT